jgi:hypothetical protein
LKEGSGVEGVEGSRGTEDRRLSRGPRASGGCPLTSGRRPLGPRWVSAPVRAGPRRSAPVRAGP